MEAIGHQLMAMRIDDQMVDILQTQLVQITDKFSSGWGQSMGTDCRFVAEALYYGMSFVQRSAAKRNATPGMSAVDLGIDGGATGLVDNANALLVMSYLVLKWSLVKLQNIATLEGWSGSEDGSVERRTYEVVKQGSLAVRCISVLSYVVFLARGDSPSMLYRLTGITMRPVANEVAGLVSTHGPNTAAGAVAAVAAAAVPPGYKSSQLFVEGKKMLWLALLGATAAASITIDWQALRLYLYFCAHSLTSALLQLRRSAVNSAPLRAATAYYARMIRLLSSVLHRGPLSSAEGGTGGSGSGTAAASEDVSSNDDNNEAGLIPERSEGAATGSSSTWQHNTLSQPQQQQQCSACQLAPPEMPHTADCGHVYCYLCIHKHVHSANSASQFDIFSGTDRVAGAACLVCYSSIKNYSPQTL